MVWQLLAKPLLGVAADTVRGFVETKKAKAELKVTEVKAATKLKQDQIAGKVKWETTAVDQMKGSWKDELILICLLAPATLVFFPGMTEHIHAGFVALQFFQIILRHRFRRNHLPEGCQSAGIADHGSCRQGFAS